MEKTTTNRDHFKDVVLPSVGLPPKTSYNIPESLKIFDCSRSYLWKLNHLGVITITQNKRIYYKDFENYFSKPTHYPRKSKPRKRTKP